MDPDVAQSYAVSHADRAFTSDAPTLRTADEAFGRNTSAEWLVGQLGNLSEFCGSKDKLTNEQIGSLARSIVAYYPQLKMSELLLFFGRFKMGEYGRFYGNVDPIVITSALRTFMDQRAGARVRIEAQENMKRLNEQMQEPTMTYDEWQQKKSNQQE